MGEAERFQIVRPLGVEATGYVARDTSVTPPRLVVLERATRASPKGDERAGVVQRCKALVRLEHPKVVPIREVVERSGEVLVVCDFVDGEWLSALMGLDPRPPVEVLLRVVLDVLEGLAALHDLKDEKGQHLKIVHGSLSPDSVLVADDGVAEIARPFGTAPQKPDRFVAPELRRGEAPADVRADVYSAGAMLREVLGSASAEAKWAEQLTDIAWRACSVDPENRWPSAASMATTLRRIAGSKLASSDDLAKFLRRYFGSRMNARRASLDLVDESGPPSSGEPISLRPSDMMVIEPPSAPTLVESRPPPVPHRAPIAKVALVKKSLELVEIPEPAVERPVASVAQKGMSAIAPPPVQILEAPMRPKAASLPPPDIIVPEEVEPAPRPAPSARPAPPSMRAKAASQPDEVSESYRRQMPTFPIMEPPPRRSTGVQAMAIAAAMVITFGVGWWLGRNYPPPAEATQAACASLVTPPVVQAAPTPVIVPTVVATASASTAPVPSVSAVGVIGAPSATAGTIAMVTTAAPTAPTTSAVGVARPVTGMAPPVVAPKPSGAAPITSAVEPKPTAEPKPAPAPRPAGSAGYVPGEL
jgi:hypothetical protein